jgi:hypothetical protein
MKHRHRGTPKPPESEPVDPARFKIPVHQLENPSASAARLRKLTAPLLKAATEDLKKLEYVAPTFAFYKDGKQKNFRLPGHLAQIMNSGLGKDALFLQMREVCDSLKPNAMAFVSDGFFTSSMPKVVDMSLDQFEALRRAKSIQQMVEEGLLAQHEAIMVTIQTVKEVLLTTLFYIREAGEILIDPRGPSEVLMRESEFHGRQKMFGKLEPDFFHNAADAEATVRRKKE